MRDGSTEFGPPHGVAMPCASGKEHGFWPMITCGCCQSTWMPDPTARCWSPRARCTRGPLFFSSFCLHVCAPVVAHGGLHFQVFRIRKTGFFLSVSILIESFPRGRRALGEAPGEMKLLVPYFVLYRVMGGVRWTFGARRGPSPTSRCLRGAISRSHPTLRPSPIIQQF